MPQCKHEKRIGDGIAYCILETPHAGRRHEYDAASVKALRHGDDSDPTRKLRRSSATDEQG